MRRVVFMMIPLLTLGAAEPPSGLTLPDDYTVSAKISGLSFKIRIDPGYSGYTAVNPDVVGRAKLKPSMVGTRHRIGPVTLGFWTDEAKVDYGLGEAKHRVMWPKAPFVSGVDGLAGPNALPWSRLTFPIGRKAAGEQEFTLPMEAHGAKGAFSRFKLGDEEVRVWFSLMLPQSLATAGLGAELAKVHGGELVGPVVSREIRFGVKRPVRTLQLATPLVIAGRGLASLGIRMSDFGNASAIPDAKASEDPDEIVVTASKPGKRNYTLLIGRDFLNGCSSITYDFTVKLIRLSCVAS